MFRKIRTRNQVRPKNRIQARVCKVLSRMSSRETPTAIDATHITQPAIDSNQRSATYSPSKSFTQPFHSTSPQSLNPSNHPLKFPSLSFTNRTIPPLSSILPTAISRGIENTTTTTVPTTTPKQYTQ